MSMPVLAMLLAAGLSWADVLPREAMSALVDRMRATDPVRVESTLTLEVRVGDVPAHVPRPREEASLGLEVAERRGLGRGRREAMDASTD